MIVVHSAGIQDRDGARKVLSPLAHCFTRLRKIWADGIYTGDLAEWVRNLRTRNRIDFEMVKRTDKMSTEFAEHKLSEDWFDTMY